MAVKSTVIGRYALRLTIWPMDDRRAGLTIRALRRRRGWRQVDLGAHAGVSQTVVSRVERGHVESLSMRVVRRLLLALDARAELDIRWRGGELDRLLDEAHARLGAIVATQLAGLGWQVLPEVTFRRLGERGSIDLLAVNEQRRVALLIELKSELNSYEQTQRRLDVKARVGASVVEERLGWRPRHLAVVLVLADTSTNRERAARVAALLRAALPAGNLEIRRWLRDPIGNLRGVWFVRDIRGRTGKCKRGGSHRVRLARMPGG